MHLPQHQQMLRNAAKCGGVDLAIEQIRRERPSAFHIEIGGTETLSSREFQHAPATSVLHRRCVTRKGVAGLYARDEHLKRLANMAASIASNSSEATDELAAVV
ncbi:hypothetical protein [Paraburkholderia sp. J12]|uniref:hypothetical protein n=1 Tax=Paraburkholderia sp. J12 TaxID=2805432 RepID=UPI002ABD486B|nr:hypothetical protein [Paraburkholderia sp. J12]